jgi:hypothetical protein
MHLDILHNIKITERKIIVCFKEERLKTETCGISYLHRSRILYEMSVF